ncbi:MAG: hypothetical protein JO190_11450, partial [Candidatus Eremiobacteraeota bacterium]|nr:hypothetical protein [Candidatus Eremiobacteraeota bacterium]
MKPLRNLAAASAAISTLAACSASNAPALPPARSSEVFQSVLGTGAGKIEHVVYIVQENRSFDDMFAGYPNADTASSGKTSKGQRIKLTPVSLADQYEIDHSANAMFEACDGTGKLPGTKCRMDGFDREMLYGGPPHGQYVYAPHSETKPLFDIAHEFVLGDRMFASQLDESFVAHQYIIAAQAHSSVNVPDSNWGCEGAAGDQVATITRQRRYGGGQRPCFNYATLGDELDAAGLSWRFYTSSYQIPVSGFWSGYQAVRHIF